MSILPGVNITSLILITQRFAWCTSVGFINGCETFKTIQRFDYLSKTLFSTLLIHYTFSLRPFSFMFIQELRCNNQRCSLLTFECGTGVTSFAQLKLAGACHHCLRLESPRLGWRQNSCNSSTNPLSRK